MNVNILKLYSTPLKKKKDNFPVSENNSFTTLPDLPPNCVSFLLKPS